MRLFPSLDEQFQLAMLGSPAPAPAQPAGDLASNPFLQMMSNAAPQPPPADLPAPPPPPAVDPWEQAKARYAPALPAQAPAKRQTTDQVVAGGMQRQEDATRIQGAAEAEKADVTAAGALAAANQLAARQKADEEVRAKADVDAGQKRSALEAEVAQLANTRIDRGRLFREQSTQQAIFQGIGLALGGIVGAADGSGKNRSIDMVMNRINQDVQDQITEIETKRGALGQKQTMLQQEIAAGKDSYEARVKATAAAYDTVISQVKAEAAKRDSPAIMARAEEAIGKIEQAKGTLYEQWAQERKRTAIAGGHLALARDEAEERKKQFEATYALQVQDALSKGNAAKAAQLQAQQEKAIFAVSNDANGVIVAPSEKVAGEVNDRISKGELIVKGLDRLVELRSLNGGGGIGVWPNDMRKEAESIVRDLGPYASVFKGQGAMSDDERAQWLDTVGDPTAWRDTESRIKAVRNNIIEAVNSDITNKTVNGKGVRWSPQLRPAGMKVGGVDYQPPKPGAQVPAEAQGGEGHWDAATKMWVRDLPAAPSLPPSSINLYDPTKY